MRFPSPPVVSSAFSGFVVGILVTLAATGVFSHASKPSASPTLPPVRLVGDPQLWAAVHRLATQKLGPFTDEKRARLVAVNLSPISSLEALADPRLSISKYRSAKIVFRLNNHPLGASWRFKAAKADVFALLKALYTSDLPIYDVELIGIFPVSSGKTIAERQVMTAYETHDAAARIPWRRWGRDKEAALWSQLTYRQVNPKFA